MDRRQSVGAATLRRQSSGAAPVMEMVTVAVLPQRLRKGMTPPTGIGASDCFAWDEAVNWRHNEELQDDSKDHPDKKKGLMRKMGLTTKREPRNKDSPPFIMKQVPYEVWRKHYAKDKEGYYHGTHAPAEDCLLKPEDVAKWRLEEPKTKADQWTRGAEALPVYDEVKEAGSAPDYHADSAPAPAQPVSELQPVPEPATQRTSSYSVNGKSAQQIIDEARGKNASKDPSQRGWKGVLASGLRGTMGA